MNRADLTDRLERAALRRQGLALDPDEVAELAAYIEELRDEACAWEDE